MDVTKIEAVDKLWGKTWPVFRSDHCEVWAIEVVSGGYSSRHFHERKSNSFFVQSGCLNVRILHRSWVAATGRVVTLRAGDSLDLQAGVVHQFEALEPTIAIETYYSKEGMCCQNDIQRFSVGGICESIKFTGTIKEVDLSGGEFNTMRFSGDHEFTEIPRIRRLGTEGAA